MGGRLTRDALLRKAEVTIGNCGNVGASAVTGTYSYNSLDQVTQISYGTATTVRTSATTARAGQQITDAASAYAWDELGRVVSAGQTPAARWSR